ncbi:dGTP triphosphohydrolase [Clostridium butyricum]|uniref:dGTP triphosphohydrolase n=1 Tax=Clostridium butyricum TaxID=1492 RepID=UPI00374FD8E2
MGKKLLWDKLFSGKRERESSTYMDHRNEFDKDYDRVVYSSSVRRLQDKAQVFPLQENDFTRTRLTHSIEASALARSLGLSIEQWLLENDEIQEKHRRYLPSLLQVSALIHDLGNPPFGHYGEDIIKNWFSNWFDSDEFKDFNEKLPENIRLNEEEKFDFINFEGNSQTLRIVTKLQMLNDQYGVNFTYGTLATIMKYPWLSCDNRFINDHCKKFGYFKSEQSIAKRVQEATGLEDGIRHPATFLLEASDDIAYLCADMEDAVKKGIIPWYSEYTRIKNELLKKDYDKYYKVFESLDKKKNNIETNEIPDGVIASVQNFKVSMQGLLFNGAIKAFKDNYDKIMNGEFEHNSLIENCGLDDLVKELKDLAIKYCFVDKEVLTLELVGDKVINGLLDIFIPSLIKCNEKPKPKKKEGKLYEMISPNFKYICECDYDRSFKTKKIELKNFTDIRLYDKLLLITDFISGMTDSYAVNLYKELIGVKLP